MPYHCIMENGTHTMNTENSKSNTSTLLKSIVELIYKRVDVLVDRELEAKHDRNELENLSIGSKYQLGYQDGLAQAFRIAEEMVREDAELIHNLLQKYESTSIEEAVTEVNNSGTAPLEYDTEGSPFFMIGEHKWYINEFMATDLRNFDGVAHISNAGGIGIKIDHDTDEVKYTFRY